MNSAIVHCKPSIAPRELHQRMADGLPLELLDVRTPAEHAAVHIPGARLLPLDKLDAAAFLANRRKTDVPLCILCVSGVRAAKAREKFQRAGFAECVVVEGGIDAWIQAGLPVQRGESRVIPMIRQVQITVGVLSATGAALALGVNTWFAVIPLITGCGLLFAGLTGTCGLALILAKMPWNRQVTNSSNSCCEACH
ncbi:MAG TPA: rhodanese-like domain-containing protein [Verrucomicrobiae bacterium]|nr:rhodanese-like domain-containing protein [Verrucomicrobiae bacterium]